MVAEHFASEEFGQPNRHGFEAVPYPDAWISERLMPLCEVLEKVRAYFGEPVEILSGYRTPEYNAAVGGQPASQHLEGRAADIVVATASSEMVHDALLMLSGRGDIEIGGLGLYPGFTHVDIRPWTGHLARWVGSRSLS